MIEILICFLFSSYGVVVNEVWGGRTENGFLTCLNAQPLSNHYVYIASTNFFCISGWIFPQFRRCFTSDLSHGHGIHISKELELCLSLFSLVSPLNLGESWRIGILASHILLQNRCQAGSSRLLLSDVEAVD